MMAVMVNTDTDCTKCGAAALESQLAWQGIVGALAENKG